VRFTINTDGPYLLDTNMRTEVRLLRESGVLSEEQLEQALRWAREATFITDPPDGQKSSAPSAS
jgi:adenosine deaminase